ncbi:MAG: diguanylate cyclase [Anaeromyxobacter sp.]
MARRILVADDSLSVLAAVRRALEPAGYEVEALPLSAVPPAEPFGAAVVRGTAAGAPLVARLRAADPLLPVLALFHDEDEAAQHVASPEAAGVLVGPLLAQAVVGAVRAAEALGDARRQVRALEAGPAAAHELAFFKRMMLLEVKRSKRYRFPVSLALVAVDGWPALSAGLGAAGSTALLSELLGLLTASLRDIDLAVPFGEDRFVVLLPHTPPEQALGAARRLVRRLRDCDAQPALTVSAGVAGHAGEGALSFGALVKQAAAALTRARAEGGDRAEPAGPPPPRSRISMG